MTTTALIQIKKNNEIVKHCNAVAIEAFGSNEILKHSNVVAIEAHGQYLQESRATAGSWWEESWYATEEDVYSFKSWCSTLRDLDFPAGEEIDMAPTNDYERCPSSGSYTWGKRKHGIGPENANCIDQTAMGPCPKKRKLGL